MDRFVLCMKWGTRYPSQYVNILYNAVQRNLSVPHRFVCLTDDPAGLNPSIEALDLPRAGIPDAFWTDRGIWGKLALFQPDLHGLSGRALFLDLDMLITGSLDEMFSYKDDHVFVSVAGGPKWRRGVENDTPLLSTTAFRFDIGSQNQILEGFLADPASIKARYGIEQKYVEAAVTDWTTFPSEWIVSFKRHLRRPLGVDLFLEPRKPEPPVKCVSFHGDPNPWDMVPKNAGFWGALPHYGRGPVSWVRDNWLANGFED